MYEARLGTDNFCKVSEEGNDVVPSFALDLVDALHIERRILGLGPDGFSRFLRDHPEFGLGVRRVSLDLEPDFNTGLRFPDRSHLRASITGDHGRPLRFSEVMPEFEVWPNFVESGFSIIFSFRMIL